MKKKYITLALSLLVAVSMTACGENGQTQTPSQPQKTAPTEVKPEKKIEILENVEEIGEGECYLIGPGGTTEDGSALPVFASPDTVIMQIGIDARDMDGSKLSYMYIDGNLVQKEQMANYQGSLDLEKSSLKPGIHQVIVKQFDNNKEDGKLVFQHEMKYDLIEK